MTSMQLISHQNIVHILIITILVHQNKSHNQINAVFELSLQIAIIWYILLVSYQSEYTLLIQKVYCHGSMKKPVESALLKNESQVKT